MVRVGGGWETLEHFLLKHDPCRADHLAAGREKTPSIQRDQLIVHVSLYLQSKRLRPSQRTLGREQENCELYSATATVMFSSYACALLGGRG